MATESQNIFINKKPNFHCAQCKKVIKEGEMFVDIQEQQKGKCFTCSSFDNYVFLPPGDAALTRRSKKYSKACGLLLVWSKSRKRFERNGIYVEAAAIEAARLECEQDKEKREQKNKKAAVVAEIKDKEYIHNFGLAIRAYFPRCPQKREFAIAAHACEKHSGRVGRTAHAKQFDPEMIERAVEAHIRHTETNYDSQFGKGKGKREIRADLSYTIKSIMRSWK